jgi:hypothetical protein
MRLDVDLHLKAVVRNNGAHHPIRMTLEKVAPFGRDRLSLSGLSGTLAQATSISPDGIREMRKPTRSRYASTALAVAAVPREGGRT